MIDIVSTFRSYALNQDGSQRPPDEVIQVRVSLLLDAAAGIERLVKQNNVLVRKCDPFLSSADLKAVDKHCDWVAFGHAYRAMLNVRAELSGDKHE
jgi:hypothetical protein